MGEKSYRKTHPSLRQRSRDLRKQQTRAEQILWKSIRNRKLGGYKIRRQHPIAGFIVDFYCAKTKLVIELDGPVHLRQKRSDQQRTSILESRGCLVIRFPNDSVMKNLTHVLQTIRITCDKLTLESGKDTNRNNTEKFV